MYLNTSLVFRTPKLTLAVVFSYIEIARQLELSHVAAEHKDLYDLLDQSIVACTSNKALCLVCPCQTGLSKRCIHEGVLVSTA